MVQGTHGKGQDGTIDILNMHTVIHFTSQNVFLIGSILVFTAIMVSRTGYKYGVPSLLIFLMVGMLFGSDGL